MKTCWVITNDYAGIINQALGLAEHLPVIMTHKTVTLRPFWKTTSPYIALGLSHCMTKESDPLAAPFPDLVISVGRQAVLPALYVKRASLGRTKIVHIQNPIVRRDSFDAVICPLHDKVIGDNIIPVIGTTHRVTQKRIDEESEKFRPLFEQYPSPRISILIGGPNKNYTMDDDFAKTLVAQLRDLQKRYACSLLITTSRRTPLHIIDTLKQCFNDSPCVYIYTGEGDNPYFALLGWGDHIMLTCDSVCMLSETCSTTKPVYLLPLPGKPGKFADFHRNMIATGRMGWFDGHLSQQDTYKPFNENIILSEILQKKLGWV